jgi:hypothetical protein
MAIHTLQPGEVRFPDRCVACGGAPDRALRLEAFRGIDVLAVRWGNRVEIEAPICRRCLGRRYRRRTLWFVGTILAIIAVIAVPVAILRAVGGEDAVPFALPIVLPLALGALWLARNREGEIYDRLFSPVAIARFDRRAWIVDLEIRDTALWAEVGVLSGKLGREALGGGGGAGYRQAAYAPVPVAWKGAGPRRVPWWVPLIVGAVVAAGAAGFWLQAVDAEAAGRPVDDDWIILLLYRIGGKPGVVAPFVLIVVGCVVGAVLLRRHQRRATSS